MPELLIEGTKRTSSEPCSKLGGKTPELCPAGLVLVCAAEDEAKVRPKANKKRMRKNKPRYYVRN
jgi:hypothetical protein